jgi:hypothetical protein
MEFLNRRGKKVSFALKVKVLRWFGERSERDKFLPQEGTAALFRFNVLSR